MTTLTDLVEVDALGADRYRAVTDSPLSRPTLFGGALVAQALRAAAASTDPEKHPHSVHATFVRAGQAGNGVEFQVTRTRDGRSFSTRQVTVSQGERVLATITASFHRDEPSPEYQPAADGPVPCPDDEVLAARASRGRSSLGIDVVDVSEPGEPRYLAWARSQQPLPADRVLHACAMTLVSDSGAPAVAATAIGVLAGGPDVSLGARVSDKPPRGRWQHGDAPMTTSLDHAIWFHRAGRCDDWFLVSAVPLSTAGSRGLVLGSLRDRSGRHLASFTQELLIRAGRAGVRADAGARPTN
jgi:acyl-CoA thioesterase II